MINSFLLAATIISLSKRVHYQTKRGDRPLGNNRMVVDRVNCTVVVLLPHHALHVLRDSRHHVPDPANAKRKIGESRLGQNPTWNLVDSDSDVLRVHLSCEPRAILTMVLASRRYRIRQWNLMGIIERILPD